MNARTAIQSSNSAAVLGVSFSVSRHRFIAALSDGVQVFRTDNCLATCRPSLSADGGIAIAAVLDDRYIAMAGGGRSPAAKPNMVLFWDCELDREVNRFDFYEPVLGLRLNAKWMVVILYSRAVVFEYQEITTQKSPASSSSLLEHDEDTRTETGDEELDVLKGPNRVKSIHSTSSNAHAVASLGKDLLVLPAQTPGQIQLVPLRGGSKRVLRAHNAALRQAALSSSGDLLATSSDQGTLIRVFDTRTLDQLAEFRRGVEKAVIYHLSFSENARWVAATSDKGTLHIFDLQPSAAAFAEPHAAPLADSRGSQIPRRGQASSVHRLPAAMEKESISGHSSPSNAPTAHHGSIQEYYGLRPPPASASPAGREAAASAISAIKSSPLAPRIFKDVRSVASAPFYMGNDSSHWQGESGHSWTVAPGGTRKRVKNPIPALPADPTGRPPKGIMAFARSQGSKDDQATTIYVLGGGSDPRWEMFQLLPTAAGGWTLVNRGFRRYMTRQFAE